MLLDEDVPPGEGVVEREFFVGAPTGNVEFPVRVDAKGSTTPRLLEIRLLSADSDR